MKFYEIKCRKCGYQLEVPEESLSVICGSCGERNHFSKLTSLLRKHAETGIDLQLPGEESGQHRDYPHSGTSEPSKRQSPAFPGENRSPLPDEEEENPEQKGAAKVMTAIFILTPFIAMAVDYFKLPPYTVIAAVALLIIIIVALKKRS